MRGFQDIVTTFRHAKTSRVIVSAAFIAAIMLTGVGIYQFNQTAVDAASQCNNQNDIVPNGVGNHTDVANHYNGNTCGDVKAIYDHYWIKPSLAAGDRAVEGTSNNRGEVIAEGRVVANNAASIGRQKIHASSQPISIAGQSYFQTTHAGGNAFANPGASLPTIVVLDAQGNFKYAVIKACGNPVYARPVPPPKPPVKDIQVCDLATRKLISIKEDQFDATKHSKNLADCEPIKVCVIETKEWVTIKKNEYDETKHSTNPKDCEDVMIEVCDLKSMTIITINEEQFDEKKHSRNLADCEKPDKLIVCDLTTKQVISIDADQFDATKHSKNLEDCKDKCPIPGKEHLPANSAECEEPVVTPPAPQTPSELPKTGPADFLGAGVGLAAMGVSAYYYAASRRLF